MCKTLYLPGGKYGDNERSIGRIAERLPQSARAGFFAVLPWYLRNNVYDTMLIYHGMPDQKQLLKKIDLSLHDRPILVNLYQDECKYL
jgi:hypothetical protein